MADPVDISPQRITTLAVSLMFMAEVSNISSNEAEQLRQAAHVLMAMHLRLEETIGYLAEYETDRHATLDRVTQARQVRGDIR